MHILPIRIIIPYYVYAQAEVSFIMQRQRIRFQRIFDRQRFQREARQRKRQVASVALRSLMVKLVEYSDSEEDSDESLDPRNARAWAAFDTRHKRSASTSADVAARHELQQNGGLRKRTSSGAAEAMDAFTSAKRSSGANPVVTSVTYTHVVTTDPMTGHESVTTRYEVATTAPADAASGGNHAHGVAAAATASSRPAASLFAAQQYSEHIDRKYGFGSAVPVKNAFGGATAQWTQQPMAFDTSTYGQSASRFEQGEDEEEDEDSHEHEEDDDDDEIDNDDSEEDEEDEDETEQEENAEEFEGLSVTGRQQQHVYFDHGEDEDVDLDENYYGEKADEDDDDDGSSIDIEQDDDHERRESHEYESAQDVDYDDEEKSGSETEEGVLPPASSSAGERKSRMFHWEDENMDDKASTKSAKVTSESKGQASATVNGSTAQSVFTNAFGSKETVSNLPWTFGFSSTSGCQTQTSSNNSTKQGIFSSQSWQSQQPSPFAASQGSIFSAGTMSTSRSAGVRRRSRPMAATTTFQRTSDKRTTVETVFGVKDGDAPSSATRTFASMPFTFRSRVPASSGLFSFGSAAHSDDAHSSRQESRSQFTFGQSTSSESESSTTSRGASPLFAVGNKNPLFAPPKPIFGAVDTMSKDSSVLFTDIFKPASTQSEDTSAKVQSALGKDHEANFWFTVPHSDWNCAATKPPTSDEKEAQPGKQSAFTFNENASSGVGNRAVGNKPSSKPAASAGLFSKGMQSPNRERIAAKRRILIPSRTTPIQGRRPTTSEPHVSPAFGSSKFASQSPFTFPAGSPPQDTPISHHGSTTAKQFVFGSTPKVSTTPGASSNANPFVFGVGESTSFPKNGTKIFVTAPRFQGVFGSVKPSSESPFSAPASTAQQAASAKNSGSNQGAFVFGSTPQPVHAQSQSSSIGGENARFPFGMQNPSTPFQFGKVSSDNTGRASGPEVEPLKSAFGDFTIGSTSLNPTGTTNHRVRRRVNSFSKWKSNIRTSVNEEPVRKETEAARAAKPSFGFAGVNKDSKSFVDTSTNPFAVPSFDQRKKAFATNGSQWRTGNDGKPNQPHSAFETTNAATENGSSIFQKREAKMSTVEEQLVTPTKGTGLFGFAASTATQTMSSEKSPFGSVATGKSLNNIQAPSVKQQPASTIKTVFGSKSSQATQAGNSSGTSSQPFANRDRRILRAMLPKTASFETKEPNRDTEDEKMEDERTWGDLKELGGAAYSSRRYQEAAEYYRQSIDLVDSLIQRQPELKTIALMKDKAKLHSNRAASLMMMMQIIEAQRECRSSIEADPLYSRAYLRLCRVQVLLGDMEHAKQNLINARRIMQSDSHADSADLSMIKKMESTIEQLNVHTNMIKRMIEVKDLSSALDQLSKALALAPNSRALQLQKAQVLFQLK